MMHISERLAETVLSKTRQKFFLANAEMKCLTANKMCNGKQAISARERALCQLCVLSFRVEVKEENTVNAIFFGVTTNLLNSENLKAAFAQLWNELLVCNFTMV